MGLCIDVIFIGQRDIRHGVSLHKARLSGHHQNFVSSSDATNWIVCRLNRVTSIRASSWGPSSCTQHTAPRRVVNVIQPFGRGQGLVATAIFLLLLGWIHPQSGPTLSRSKMPDKKGISWSHDNMAASDTQVQRLNMDLKKMEKLNWSRGLFWAYF